MLPEFVMLFFSLFLFLYSILYTFSSGSYVFRRVVQLGGNFTVCVSHRLSGELAGRSMYALCMLIIVCIISLIDVVHVDLL